MKRLIQLGSLPFGNILFKASIIRAKKKDLSQKKKKIRTKKREKEDALVRGLLMIESIVMDPNNQNNKRACRRLPPNLFPPCSRFRSLIVHNSTKEGDGLGTYASSYCSFCLMRNARCERNPFSTWKC